jgi:DNA polymerase III alpha subunit
MQIAMDAAKFSAGKADELRRSMAAWKRKGGVHKFERPLIDGMVARGYKLEFAQAIFAQMLGFGEYGFPESHAYSFALLAYASAWLKRHEPAIFLQALLNAQPMGFIRRPNWCRMRAAMACACCRSMSAIATGIARWKPLCKPCAAWPSPSRPCAWG